MELEYWVVEAVDETYHQTPDEGENLHRVGLPIVAGPFDTYDEAAQVANEPQMKTHWGQMAVALPEGAVEGWDEE